MGYITAALIDELLGTLAAQRAAVVALRAVPMELLHQRPAPERWSVMEVLEHMNLSSGHYLERVQRIFASDPRRLSMRDTYAPGKLGERFVQGMRPDAEGKISWRMRTLWLFEPRTERIAGYAALDRFLAMIDGFTHVLEQARIHGLEGPRVTSTLGPIIRFKLGDAIRFPIAHQERHLVQIERTLQRLNARS